MSNLNSFQDCLTKLEPVAIEAIDLANKACNSSTYKKALTDIRISMEFLCAAIAFHKDPNNAWALLQKPNRPNEMQALGYLINNIVGAPSRLWLSVNADLTDNDKRKEIFHKLRELGNDGPHASEGTLRNCEDAKVYFRQVLEWFYVVFLQSTLPADLQKVMNSNMLSPDERERNAKLFDYYTKLKGEYEQVVLNDEKGMTLKDIYIEPSVRFWENAQEGKFFKPKSVSLLDIQVDLHPFANAFNNWAETPPLYPLKTIEKFPQLFLILGYPGQGKTSFCRRLQYDLLSPDKLLENKFFKIQLRNIQPAKYLFEEPIDALLKEASQDTKITLTREEFCTGLLVLDGLDELAMQERSNKDDVDNFIKNLNRQLERYPRWRIIITSRYGYVDIDAMQRQPIYIAEIVRLHLHQQIKWLENYKVFYPESILDADKLEEIVTGIETKYQYLKELIGQPILLHLVASANLDLELPTNRAAIYDQLFDRLVERTWDNRRQIAPLEGLQKEDLRIYIREIAFAIYQSEHQYLRKSELEKMPATKEFIKKLGTADLSTALKHLMIAFYMQETHVKAEDVHEEDSRSYAVEFLHKSLQEYLVAEKIWWDMGRFTEKKHSKYNIDSSDAALNFVFPLFSKKILSNEIKDYLEEIIELDEQTDKLSIFDRMYGFAPDLLNRHFMKEALAWHPIQGALNTFSSYWFILDLVSNIENTVPKGAKDVFVELLVYSVGKNLRITKLKGIELGGITLSSIDLPRVNLQGANLSYAKLHGSDLMYADLRGANLTGANLTGAILQEAKLTGTILSAIILKDAILTGVNLLGAYLNEANLTGAILQEASLKGCDLSGADLNSTDLSKANLRESNLSNSNLCGANLNKADLSYANLYEADLSYANLYEATLSIKQLSKTISLYETTGIPEEWITQLKADGFAYLFKRKSPKYNQEEYEDIDLPF